MVSLLPKTCRVAFKEWAGVCAALIEGRQTVIIRKGGISETAGPGEFDVEHPEFWLYPTWVHQAEQGLRTSGEQRSAADPQARDRSISILGLVTVDLVARAHSEKILPCLEEFHIFTPETIFKRFHYRRPGFWILGARVWRGDQAFALPITSEHAGCKTWVALDHPLSTSGLRPVLDDDEWARRRDRLRSVLDRAHD